MTDRTELPGAGKKGTQNVSTLPEDVGTADTPGVSGGTPVPPEEVSPTDTPDDDPETFPREYVEKLRKEAADHRVRASDRDDLAHRLHTALVAATGRLADPSDLAYDENHLVDADNMVAAIDDLLSTKPHLASRRPTGDVGQGATSTDSGVDLAGMLRRNAS